MRYNVDVNTDPNSWLNDNVSHVSPADETSPDMTRYVLTIEEAAQFFAEAGVPRAPRTITRFYAFNDLDCLRVETEKNYKYLIDRNSVERRIKQLQQVVANANKPYQDMSRHVQPNYETQPDMSRHDEKSRVTEQPSEEASQLREKVDELETEIIHLKIDKAAKEQVINLMNAERKDFITQLNTMSFQLGEATAKLQQLEANRPEPQSSHVQTTDETALREAMVVESAPAPSPEPTAATSSKPTTTPAPASEPTPAPATPEKKGNFFSRL